MSHGTTVQAKPIGVAYEISIQDLVANELLSLRTASENTV